MGGYGGASGKDKRLKDGCYYDSQKEKITDKNAIEVADYYISWGFHVVFLHERPEEKKRASRLIG